jgi:hypothetical protein
VLFTPVVDNARISGIQVRKLGDAASDSDGIPDWWRLCYFGHARGSAADISCANDDDDGDGMSNLRDYLAGTDPLDANSVFRITTAAIAGPSADRRVSKDGKAAMIVAKPAGQTGRAGFESERARNRPTRSRDRRKEIARPRELCSLGVCGGDGVCAQQRASVQTAS